MGKWRKPAKHTVIEPQWRGIFVTCNRGREMQCAREAREWFESTAEALYTNDEVLPEEQHGSVGDIEDEIRREVEGLKTDKRKLIVVHAKLGVDCVVFVQTRFPVDPVKLMLAVCAEAAARERTAKYIQKLSPVQQFIKCDEALEGIEQLKPVLEKYLRPNTKFAIRPNLRLSPVTRDKVIPAIARLVGPNHSVDLKNFDQLLMVEGLRSVLGLAVVDADAKLTERYNKFNLVQITAGRAQENVAENESERN